MFLSCCHPSDGHASWVDRSQHHPARSPAEVEPPSLQCGQLRADPHTQSGWVPVIKVAFTLSLFIRQLKGSIDKPPTAAPFSLWEPDFQDVKWLQHSCKSWTKSAHNLPFSHLPRWSILFANFTGSRPFIDQLFFYWSHRPLESWLCFMQPWMCAALFKQLFT